MPRATNAVSRHHRKKRLFQRTKGYWGGRKNQYRHATETLLRAEVFAFRDRKTRKRNFRSLWITRINAAARSHGLTYGTFIHALDKAGVKLNRKMLAAIALDDVEGFEKLAVLAKEHA